jgi:hydrocephalus-inducing protein
LINPTSGSIPPDGSAVIEVTYSGKGQQLFEQKLAIDIENRNPSDEPNGIIYEVVAESCIPGINTDRFDSIFEEQLVLPSQQHSANVMK